MFILSALLKLLKKKPRIGSFKIIFALKSFFDLKIIKYKDNKIKCTITTTLLFCHLTATEYFYNVFGITPPKYFSYNFYIKNLA